MDSGVGGSGVSESGRKLRVSTEKVTFLVLYARVQGVTQWLLEDEVVWN
jgi:hypothetical protein